MKKSFQQLLNEKLTYNDAGITNPHAFKWKERDGIYFPVDFAIISLYVYRWHLGDCSNNGLSAQTNTIYMPCETGPFRAMSEHINQEHILFPEQRGPNYWALKPANENRPEMIGPMFGGNLAYSSDSRCPHVYFIHDRFEIYRD